MNALVLFYSKKGNNRFLADQIAQARNYDVEEIRAGINGIPLLLMGMNPFLSKIKKRPEDYSDIILVGPIWMGKLIGPLKSFLKKYHQKINRLHFITCCGSGFEVKDQKFGHELVFNEVRKIMGEKVIQCTALPIGLVLPEDQRKDGQAIMDTRLTEQNFTGEFKAVFNDLMQGLT